MVDSAIIVPLICVGLTPSLKRYLNALFELFALGSFLSFNIIVLYKCDVTGVNGGRLIHPLLIQVSHDFSYLLNRAVSHSSSFCMNPLSH